MRGGVSSSSGGGTCSEAVIVSGVPGGRDTVDEAWVCRAASLGGLSGVSSETHREGAGLPPTTPPRCPVLQTAPHNTTVVPRPADCPPKHHRGAPSCRLPPKTPPRCPVLQTAPHNTTAVPRPADCPPKHHRGAPSCRLPPTTPPRCLVLQTAPQNTTENAAIGSQTQSVLACSVLLALLFFSKAWSVTFHPYVTYGWNVTYGSVRADLNNTLLRLEQ
ncbi:unnamed protein product [Arctogadus glacialis]